MHVMIIQCCLLFTWLHTLNSVNAAAIIDPDVTCYSGNGREYRGTVAKTISGKTCQSWSARTPHNHTRTPENYPCKGLDSNYCRNPDKKRKPWCYTTDSEERWEYCDVPSCGVAPGPASEPTIIPEMKCITCDGINYRGTVAKTISGKTCQSWSAQTPHSHKLMPENHPRKGLESNYCRNPDNEQMPWCYTTDSNKRWEYCQVPRCVVPGPFVPLTTTPNFSECGRPHSENGTRFKKYVFGGTPSSPGEHPWQVSLQTRTTGSSEPFRHICGGILIASCWVLTAGHCIFPKDMQVVLGGVDIRIDEPDYDQVIPVEKAIVHKDYRETDRGTAYNDIALLQLKVTDSPFCAKETRYVKTACLPNQLFPGGKDCTISGWGSTEHRYKSDKLLYAPIPLMSKEQCLDRFAKESDLLDDNMICAGDLSSGACAGDSGGPLTCKEDRVHYITGVVSWGSAECGGDGILPGVYADVHRYVDWIKKIIS